MSDETVQEPVEHRAGLLSGQITCSCGWESKKYAFAGDAIQEYSDHMAEVEGPWEENRYIQAYQTKTDNKWRWRLKEGNHEIISQGQGYSRKGNLTRFLDKEYPGIEIRWVDE